MSNEQVPLDAKLVVECYMTNPPKPIGFGVLREADGKTVAIISEESVVAAFSRFNDLKAAWLTHHRKLHPPTGD